MGRGGRGGTGFEWRPLYSLVQYLELNVKYWSAINTALAARAPLKAAVAALRKEGVRVLLGGEGFQPHSPGEGGGRLAAFPWTAALREADMTHTARDR